MTRIQRTLLSAAVFSALALVLLFLPQYALAADVGNAGINEQHTDSAALRAPTAFSRVKKLNIDELLDTSSANTFDGSLIADDSYSCVWYDFDLADLRQPALMTAFRSVSLSVSSGTVGRVSVCASAISRTSSSKLGIASLRVERYYGGRWMTVYGVSNRYTYNSNNYYYSLSRFNMASGGYYRVVCTFSATNGAITTRITRTTMSIRCR